MERFVRLEGSGDILGHKGKGGHGQEIILTQPVAMRRAEVLTV